MVNERIGGDSCGCKWSLSEASSYADWFLLTAVPADSQVIELLYGEAISRVPG